MSDKDVWFSLREQRQKLIAELTERAKEAKSLLLKRFEGEDFQYTSDIMKPFYLGQWYSEELRKYLIKKYGFSSKTVSEYIEAVLTNLGCTKTKNRKWKCPI